MQSLPFAAGADHQNRAGAVAGADEDVARARRAMDEVPGPQQALLLLDEEQAFAGEDEEVLLHVLGVVEPVRLARVEDVNADPVLLELARLGLDVRPLASTRIACPRDLGHVQHKPARRGHDRARLGLLDLRLPGGHGETLIGFDRWRSRGTSWTM